MKIVKKFRNPSNLEIIRLRNFYTTSFNLLLYGIGQTLFFIVYMPFLYKFTGSIFTTGVITTLGSIVQFLPMPWLGRLSDRYGRKLVWYFDTPFLVLGLFLFIIADNIFILIVGVLSINFGWAISFSVYQVFVSENSEETKKGLNFGILTFLLFGGNIIGSFFVLVDSRFSYSFYFYIFILILLINQTFFAIFISDPIPRKSRVHVNPALNCKTEKGIWKKILKTPKLRATVIFFTLDAFIYSISLSIYNAGLIDQYNITQQDIALLTLCSNISLMFLQIPAGHLTDKIGKKKTLIFCESFGLTFFSLLIITFLLWSIGFKNSLLSLLIIGQIINAMVATTFIPSEGISLTNLDETRRSESYGIVSLIRGIGVIPTGVIAGFLIQNVHYIASFIITIIGIIFLLWFLTKYFDSEKNKHKIEIQGKV
ncbi:MAG: MFS transporter [Candidatus Hermodarchaeota archaeon]